MKTLYPQPHTDHSVTSNVTRNKIFLVFISIIICASGFAKGTPTLDFKGYTLESGTAGADGAVYRFDKVDSKTDALIRIKGRSDALVYLANIDLATQGFDKALQPVVGYNNGTAPGPADWWMDFEVIFVQKGTSIPVTVSDFDLSAIDIDGNGDKIREYVALYGLKSYMLEAQSVLALTPVSQLINGVLTSGQRFDGPTVNFLNIDTSGTGVMVTANYVKTNSFVIRAGGVATAKNGASERMYSFYFKDFNYSTPTQVVLPTKLKSFDATLASSKAVLNWVSVMEKDMSHYVIERSRDGKNYDDVTMIFANGGESEQASYSFSDNLNSSSPGLVYYRLKMIDMDGKFSYSTVKIIRLTTKNNDMAVSVYPNPVANELRITIPAAWQNKPVNYEMYNVNGQVVKHFQNSSASQTETVGMSDVKAGVYTIRLSNGNDSAAQRIVKSN